jgi:hypothetical protein
MKRGRPSGAVATPFSVPGRLALPRPFKIQHRLHDEVTEWFSLSWTEKEDAVLETIETRFPGKWMWALHKSYCLWLGRRDCRVIPE